MFIKHSDFLFCEVQVHAFCPFFYLVVFLFFLLICSNVILKISDSLVVCAGNIFSQIITCICRFFTLSFEKWIV